MAAIAAGDAEEARKQAKRAEKLLDDPSTTRLLSAQAALGGDSEAQTAISMPRPKARKPDLSVCRARQALDVGDHKEALSLPVMRASCDRILNLSPAPCSRSKPLRKRMMPKLDAVRRDLIPEDEAKRYRLAIDMERARLKQEAGDPGGALISH